MATLAEHIQEYRQGVVSETGFRALADAEVYGSASSIGALEQALAFLWQVLCKQEPLTVQHPRHGRSEIRSTGEFERWCNEYFPSVDFTRVQQL